MVEINVDRRLRLIDMLLDSTEIKVKNCDLSSSLRPNILEYFGSTSGNLMLVDVAIHDGKATENQINEFKILRNRYDYLEKDFIENCDCKKILK